MEDSDPSGARDEVGPEGESPEIVGDGDLIWVGVGELAEFASCLMDGVCPIEAEVGAMGAGLGGWVEEGDERRGQPVLRIEVQVAAED